MAPGGAVKKLFFALYRFVVRLFTGTRIGEVYPINILHAKVMRALKPSRVEIDGLVLRLDPGDSLGLSLHGAYEGYERELLRQWVQPGDRVLDVGANLGLYTLLLARQVGSEGRVTAFEPDPDSFALLRENLEANGFGDGQGRVALYQKAVSDRDGTLRLFLAESNKGDHRTYDSQDGRRSVEIEAVALDTLLPPGERVDVVKMDIQGSELSALRGMTRLLSEQPRVVLFTELWPEGLQRAGASARDYLEALRKLGFTLWEIQEEERRLTEVDDGALLTRLAGIREGHTNLLGVKGPLEAEGAEERTTSP
jgi:FkbM family methyltransferase